MRIYRNIVWTFAALVLGCQPANFSQWRTEAFGETPITQSETKTLSLRNESGKSVQKLLGVGFDGSGNGRAHFRIDKVMVGTKVVGLKAIVIPPGSALNIQMTYQPRDLETTQADFGGWVTGEPERFIPHHPDQPPEPKTTEEAIHRVVLLAVYETPQSGMTMIQLVGKAVPGPNGEISLPETAEGECETGGDTVCFTGTFALDIPDLFTAGPIEENLLGPIPFILTDGLAQLRMETMPPILIVLKGNGPGEPLEGQPINAASIIIRGVPGVVAEGSFDGSRLELNDLSFRILVVVGEVSPEQIAGANPIVDFSLEGLTLTTVEPYTDGHIQLLIDTTLSENPSGNPIFDEFLGGKQIQVQFSGLLAL